jgi:transposase
VQEAEASGGSPGRVAERRLGALQLAELLGNVSEACRRLGIDRGTFYDWQRRFRAAGMDGLRPSHRRRGRTSTKASAALDSLRRAALAHPGWGCGRLARALAGEGVRLSPPTVQDALRRLGLPRRVDRALRLERLARDRGIGLDAEQIAVIERFDPGYRDRAAAASRPGERLLQGAFHLGTVHGRRIHVHCVLDAYSGFAFARLADGRGRAQTAGALLEHAVAWLRARGLDPLVVATPGSPPFSDAGDGPFRRALVRCGLGQYRAPAVPGQVERFRRHVQDELLHGDGHLLVDEPPEGLGRRFEACLAGYNSRPLDGYPNFGTAAVVRLGAA